MLSFFVFIHSQEVIIESIISFRSFLLDFKIGVFGRIVSLPGTDCFWKRRLKRTALLWFDFLFSIELVVVNLDFVGVGKKTCGVDCLLVSFEFVGFNVDFVKIEFMERRCADILDTERPGWGLILFIFAVATEFGLEFVSFLRIRRGLLKCQRGRVKEWQFCCSF